MTLIEWIAQSLIVTPAFVEQMASTASHRYKRYEIPKRSGGTREIHHPAKPLKALQRWLLEHVICKFPVHASARAYRRGEPNGIASNAMAHRKSNFLLRMDFKNFFPSISSVDVNRYATEHAPRYWRWWSAEDSAVFEKLVCRSGCLTIGAPTSPTLSNALCRQLDIDLSSISSSFGVTYTRYADDLFFSCRDKDVLTNVESTVHRVVADLTFPKGLTLNATKTVHFSKRQRRVVTGLVLTCDGKISIGRPLKRRIHAMVHQVNALDAEQRARLSGLLAYCADVEPDFINALNIRYGGSVMMKARSPS